jgi:lipopolysaccharide export system permease protein
LFLGLPLILKRENRNVFAAIGLCGLLVLGFMLMVISCHWLGAQTYVSAARAAWLPVLIAVPAAVWISQPLRE